MNVLDLPEEILLKVISFLYWEDHERFCKSSKKADKNLNTLSIYLYLLDLDMPFESDSEKEDNKVVKFLNEDVDSVGSDDIHLDFLYS